MTVTVKIIVPPDLKADKRPCQHAFAFELTGFDISLHAVARFSLPALM